jgi:hypothetical protein
MLCMKWRNGNREKKHFAASWIDVNASILFLLIYSPYGPRDFLRRDSIWLLPLITQILQKVPEGKMMLFEVCVPQYIFIRTPKLKLSQTILCIYIYLFIYKACNFGFGLIETSRELLDPSEGVQIHSDQPNLVCKLCYTFWWWQCLCENVD